MRLCLHSGLEKLTRGSRPGETLFNQNNEIVSSSITDHRTGINFMVC